jgi:hypothetical protein
MNELKTLSTVFNVFKILGLIVGVTCLLFCLIISSVDGPEAWTLLSIGIMGFVSAIYCWISKVLIDALNHIVVAARKYTND